MKIPLPERGQPIDVVYLYQMATVINEMANQISSATYNYTTVDTVDAGRQSIQTAQAMIFAGTVSVVPNESVIKDTSRTWYINLPPGYKYAPNVTCTAVNTGTSATGNDVLLTLTSVTKERVDGTIKFLSNGVASVSVNVHAIGIPG